MKIPVHYVSVYSYVFCCKKHNKLATRIFYVSVLLAPRLIWIKIDSSELIRKNDDEQRGHRVNEKAARPATNATSFATRTNATAEKTERNSNRGDIEISTAICYQ